MRGAIALLFIALGLAGCKSDIPTADPFSNHPIVPPPPTGSCPLPQTDPGYAPNTLPTQAQPAKPGFPVNTSGSPAPGAPPASYLNPNSTPSGSSGSGWSAPPATGQQPFSPGTISAPSGTNLGNPGSNPAPTGSSVLPPPNPYSATRPIYGGSANGLGTAPTSGIPASNTSTPNLIPPPSTAQPGGYPTSPTNLAPPPSGASAAPNVNPYGYGTPSGINNTRGATTPPNLNSPRPTSTRAAISNTGAGDGPARGNTFSNASSATTIPNAGVGNGSAYGNTISNARPATAAPNGAAPLDYRSPRPVDNTTQPASSQATPLMNVPANSTSATRAIPISNSSTSAVAARPPAERQLGVRSLQPQPVQMPIAPTAYQNSLASPPYCASIQPFDIEPNWQPCDDYKDEGE